MKKCQNCGTESDGKYCPACGQEVELKRLEVKTIFHDITHGILHWENSILKTFQLILTKPGETVKKYISGQRKNFVKPFTYFIFIQTVYVLIFHWIGGEKFAFANFEVKPNEANADKIHDIQKLVDAFINYFNYAMPLFFALFLYLFFKKKNNINFAESIAISFYWIGTTLIFGIVLMPLSLLSSGLFSLRFIFIYVFLTFSILRFTKMPKLKGIFISYFVIIFSHILYVVFVMLILILYLSFKY